MVIRLRWFVRRLAAAAVGGYVFFGCAYLPGIRAQSPQGVPTASFEVASIKPQPWTNEGGVDVYVRGNTLYAEHADLYLLVEFAYGLPPESHRVSGGPAWAMHGLLSNVSGENETLFRVIAKAPDGPPPSRDGFRLALQSLLMDRFRLQVHHEQKNLPVYSLVEARKGAKLVENHSDVSEAWSMADGPPFRMRAVHAPVSRLVEELASYNHGVGRPVIDKTQLPGIYDFQISWAPNDLAGGELGPSAFTAVGELGLTLESTTAPFDMIVIDHAEKPSAN